MRARDIMTPDPTTIEESATVEHASRILDHHDIGALPVIGEDSRLRAILTDRDVVVKALAHGRDVATTAVRELAHAAPVSIKPDDSLRHTISTMAQHGVRRLPVVDGDTLVGIVSQADVARHAGAKKAGKLLRRISDAAPTKSRRTRSRTPLVLAIAVPAAAGLGVLAWRRLASSRRRVEESREIAVPVHEAYRQWSKFEQFPEFMDGIEEVRKTADDRLHWVAGSGGHRRAWDARIVEQKKDKRIAWESTSAAGPDGAVVFEELGPDRTRVHLSLDYAPVGVVETVGGALRLDNRRVRGDLDRFTKLVEGRVAGSGD